MQPMPFPLEITCHECEHTFQMVNFEATCPECGMVYGVTPCSADNRGQRQGGRHRFLISRVMDERKAPGTFPGAFS